MRQQRKMLQMKEENKEQLSEVEIGNFLKKNSE